MPITMSGNQAVFEGACLVEEALALQEFLCAHPAPKVDLHGCTYLHMSLLQLLMHARPEISRPPVDTQLATFVAPQLHHPRGWHPSA